MNYLEIFEQYHDDLRKIKKIFKYSNLNFLKFYENMQHVISDCNPNSKWFRNDELFLLIKMNISNYMNVINDHAKYFINLHKFLKDYGNDFKEFKKKIYSKVKSFNSSKNSQKDRLPIDTFDLNNEIVKKFEELDYYLLSSYQKFEKFILPYDDSKENPHIEKSHLKSSNGMKSRCLTPVQRDVNNRKHFVSIKSHLNEKTTKIEKLKKLSFQNHEKITLNKENMSMKDQCVSNNESEKERNIQSSIEESKNNRINDPCENKKDSSNILENEKDLGDNKSHFSSNKENLKDESNLSEISRNTYKSRKRKTDHSKKPSINIHN